jgi:hypothetical protein
MNPKPLSRTALATMTAARFLAAIVFVGCTLFLPAGTLSYWQAWLYMGLFSSVAIVGVVLVIRPQLLEQRMRRKGALSAGHSVVGILLRRCFSSRA